MISYTIEQEFIMMSDVRYLYYNDEIIINYKVFDNDWSDIDVNEH